MKASTVDKHPEMTSAERHGTRIEAPAKLNLFLQVTGKRPDGYHELCTLMCAVSLYDSITLRFGGNEIVTRCAHPDVPEDETNLAHRAAAVFLSAIGCAAGIRITVDKRIPVAAGLGGGSSDAASVLMALNRRFGAPFDTAQLMKMGCRIGADVPFFIFKRPAVATGIGEKLVHFRGLKPYHAVLICPGFKVSTAAVFKNFNLRLTNREKILKNSLFIDMAFDAPDHLHNDLEAVTAAQFPEIHALKALLLHHGAAGAAMSGSGPTVFGLFTNRTTAQIAYRAVDGQAPKRRVFLVDVLR